MRAQSPRRRGNAGWRRIDIAPDKLPKWGAQLRECGMVASEDDPVSAHAHYDRAGRLRRLHAVYADGWRATLSVRLDGGYSLSQAIKLVTQPKGEQA